MGRFRLLLILLFAVLLLPAVARAQAWATNGILIAPAGLTPFGTTACSDGSGGVYVAWAEWASLDVDLYLQHFDANGNRVSGWGADGITVCSAQHTQFMPMLVPDGSGGVYVVWEDYRLTGIDPDLYVTRVSSNGAFAAGWALDGRAVETQADRYSSFASPVADGSGGLYVVYEAQESDNSYVGIMGTRIQPGGANVPGWAAAGNWLSSYYFSHNPRAVTDGLGSLVVVFEAHDGTSQNLYAKRVRSNGTLDPSWHYGPSYKGAAVADNAAGDEHSCAIAVAADGMVAFSWLDDYKGAADSDIMVCLLDSTGIQPSVGNWWHSMDVATVVGDCGPPQMVADGAGGVMIAWHDERTVGVGGQPKLYGMRFDAGGAWTGWGNSGSALVNWYVAGDVQLLRAASGEFLASFTSTGGGDSEIRAIQFTSAGGIASGWSSVSGNAICTTAGAQGNRAIVPSSGSDAIVVWDDQRAGTAGIYGGKIQSNGVVPALSSLRSIEADGDRVTVEWLIEGALSVNVERSADGTGWEFAGPATEVASGAFRFVDEQVVAGASYAYRPVFAGGHGDAAWVSVPAALALGVRVPQGNPARGVVTLECALPASAPARLLVHDVSGRLVEERHLEGGGRRSVAWDSRSRAAGVYLVTLEQAGMVSRRKVTVLD